MKSKRAKKMPRQPRGRMTFESIVEATAQLLAQGEAITTNHIAHRAGVSIGSIYQYFNDKRAVYKELGDRIGTQVSQAALRHATRTFQQAPTSAVALHELVHFAAEQWRSPVTGRLLRMAHKAGFREPLDLYLAALERVFQSLMADHPDATADPMAVTILLQSFDGVFSHAATRTDWLEDEQKFTALVDELGFLAHAYLTGDRDAWRQIASLA